jgi:hypothetical protein
MGCYYTWLNDEDSEEVIAGYFVKAEEKPGKCPADLDISVPSAYYAKSNFNIMLTAN